MAKIDFYVVTLRPRAGQDVESVFLTRGELISFIRRGWKFETVRPFERPDFDNPNFFEQEETTDD